MQDFSGERQFVSSIWGPTCDGLDCIRQTCLLPQLDSGDWLVFKDMGAYTMCAASNFNGMPKPRSFYVAKETHWWVASRWADLAFLWKLSQLAQESEIPYWLTPETDAKGMKENM